MTSTSPADDRREIRRLARSELGFERLLPGQEEAVRSVVQGRDTLALLPTGGGKSAIYQLAGLHLDGPTIVVSPLLALQRDQLDELEDLGSGGAVLNSTLSDRARDEVLERFARGDLEFLLLAPEQLGRPDTLGRLRDGRPSLFVIDEVHCVSEWGHDFRPEYGRLGGAIEALGHPVVLGLTATASPAVRDDIIERLRLRDATIVARGANRANIELRVDHHGSVRAKQEALVTAAMDRSAGAPGSRDRACGIVYVARRGAAQSVADALAAHGIPAAAYHAGLGDRRRRDVEDAFMDGSIAVVVATIAFGMGIDKPDVRFVFHLDPSESVDAYYQEIGRAGRDGAPAVARLFYRPEDLGLRRFQASIPAIDVSLVSGLLRVLRRRSSGADVSALARDLHAPTGATTAAVDRLADLGAVSVAPGGRVRLVDRDVRSGEVAHLAVEAQERRRAIERSRVELLRGYAEADGCRRRYLLNYLGEEFEAPCGGCDNCLADAAGVRRAERRAARAPFSLHDRVRHVRFGSGAVARIEEDAVVVRFEAAGFRTFDLESVVANGLLVRESPGR